MYISERYIVEGMSDYEFQVFTYVDEKGKRKKVRVKDIVKLTKKLKPIEVPLYDLHILKDDLDKLDEDRVRSADIKYPIILYKILNRNAYKEIDSEYLIVDGMHRIKKLHDLGHKSVKAYVVPL